MSAHTPGPWRIYAGFSADRPGIEAEGISIVVWGSDDSRDDAGVHGKTREQAIANARLIAAAPDLLAALEHAASLVEFAHKFRGLELADEILPRYRTAIAKARGESPMTTMGENRTTERVNKKQKRGTA